MAQVQQQEGICRSRFAELTVVADQRAAELERQEIERLSRAAPWRKA